MSPKVELVICARSEACNYDWKPDCRHKDAHVPTPDCDEPCRWNEDVEPCPPVDFVVIRHERPLRRPVEKPEPVICNSYFVCHSAAKKTCMHKHPHLEHDHCCTRHKAQCWGALCGTCHELVLVSNERCLDEP